MPTHVKAWTQRRFNRKKSGGEPLKILHCEISEDSFNYLAALVVTSKMCKGEILDALIIRYMNEKKANNS